MTLRETFPSKTVQGLVCTLTKCDRFYPVNTFCESKETTALLFAIQKTSAKIEGFRTAFSAENSLFSDTIDFYLMMANDPELEKALRALICNQHLSAIQSVNRYFNDFVAHLEQQNEYFRNRKYDLEDLRNLFLECLSDDELHVSSPESGHHDRILFLETLLATDLVRVDFEQFAAVIAKEGGLNSHAAILLQSARIPFVIAENIPENVESGTELLIDFDHCFIKIDEKTYAFPQENCFCPSPDTETGLKNSEKDPLDSRFEWYTAINFIAEGLRVSKEQVSGVGLFRSEMMVLSENRFPSEWEQYERYAKLAKHFDPKPVFFRLWDIEPDKLPETIETHDFGAAFLINHCDLIKKQLRPLLKVSCEHFLGITIPMVRDLSEIDAIINLIEECKEEIRKESDNRVFHYFIGIMVETTSLIRQLSKLPKLDYILIGSNDLVCDRFRVSRHSKGFTPDLFHRDEFLSLLKEIVEKTDKKNIPLYLCGEAANQSEILRKIIPIGIKRFCVSPAVIDSVKSSLK